MTKKDLIDGIHIDRANLEHIAKTGKINGTLLSEINRVLDEYKALDLPATAMLSCRKSSAKLSNNNRQ